MDDLAALIVRIAEGDRRAFRELYREAAPVLLGVLRKYFRDKADAEDALHDVLVKVWRIAPKFDPERKGLPWLITVTRNHAVDIIRARREVPVADDQLEAMTDAAAGPLPDGPEMRLALERCLSELKPDHAQLVREVYVWGFTYEEAALRFDAPIGTIRTWIRRSILALRNCMGGPDS